MTQNGLYDSELQQGIEEVTNLLEKKYMTNDYQNTKPQKIRFHVTAGEENIDLVNDLIQHFAKAKDYGVSFHKIKQRGKTPLVDLHCEIYERL